MAPELAERRSLERYLLFFGSTHYPEGGWKDFRGSFPSKAEALMGAEDAVSYERMKLRPAEPGKRVWFHVVDSQFGDIVSSGKTTIPGTDYGCPDNSI